MVPFDGSDRRRGAAGHRGPAAQRLDAMVKGTMDGVAHPGRIVAMLLVTVALVSLVNMALGLLPHWGGAAVTLQRLFALPFRPVMWLIGVPWAETGAAGDADGAPRQCSTSSSPT